MVTAATIEPITSFTTLAAAASSLMSHRPPDRTGRWSVDVSDGQTDGRRIMQLRMPFTVSQLTEHVRDALEDPARADLP